MKPPGALLDGLAAELGEAVTSAEPIAGGDINDAWRVEVESGDAVFVKSRADATRADFEAEAAGLRWLREPRAIAVPVVLGIGEDPAWLALEWIERGTLDERGQRDLGSGLAELHRSGAAAHGALPPAAPDTMLRIGAVDLDLRRERSGSPAGDQADWPSVHAELHLLPLLAQARDRGAIGGGDARAVESVCERIDELAGPPEPPARLHGDLWSGNVIAGADGRPWLIDPAAYGGHREVDLAMLKLFGSPSPATTAAYEEAFPPADGHQERVELWQILPLLVHAVLFGGHYGAAAGRAAGRYL